MKNLSNETLLTLQGGRDLGCFLLVTELALVVGVGFMSGGILGGFALGMTAGLLASDKSPC